MLFRTEPGQFELITAPDGPDPFVAVRERIALVHDRPQLDAAALAHATLECRRHEPIVGTRCERCPHLLGATPADDGCSVRVHCLFLESDPIEILMTRVADLVRVDDGDSVGDALHHLYHGGVHQLPVVSGDTVVGLVDVAMLKGRPRGQRLRVLLGAALPVMPKTFSLGLAARALAASGRRCAFVVDADRVVGLVTRGDLSRAGVPGV